MRRVMDVAGWRAAGTPEDVVLRAAMTSEVRALGEARQVRFRITTGSPDRMNDTISPEGWDLANYKRNPVVLWAHKYDEPPIGRAVAISADPSGLTATTEFAT